MIGMFCLFGDFPAFCKKYLFFFILTIFLFFYTTILVKASVLIEVIKIAIVHSDNFSGISTTIYNDGDEEIYGIRVETLENDKTINILSLDISPQEIKETRVEMNCEDCHDLKKKTTFITKENISIKIYPPLQTESGQPISIGTIPQTELDSIPIGINFDVSLEEDTNKKIYEELIKEIESDISEWEQENTPEATENNFPRESTTEIVVKEPLKKPEKPGGKLNEDLDLEAPIKNFFEQLVNLTKNIASKIETRLEPLSPYLGNIFDTFLRVPFNASSSLGHTMPIKCQSCHRNKDVILRSEMDYCKSCKDRENIDLQKKALEKLESIEDKLITGLKNEKSKEALVSELNNNFSLENILANILDIKVRLKHIRETEDTSLIAALKEKNLLLKQLLGLKTFIDAAQTRESLFPGKPGVSENNTSQTLLNISDDTSETLRLISNSLALLLEIKTLRSIEEILSDFKGKKLREKKEALNLVFNLEKEYSAYLKISFKQNKKSLELADEFLQKKELPDNFNLNRFKEGKEKLEFCLNLQSGTSVSNNSLANFIRNYPSETIKILKEVKDNLNKLKYYELNNKDDSSKKIAADTLKILETLESLLFEQNNRITSVKYFLPDFESSFDDLIECLEDSANSFRDSQTNISGGVKTVDKILTSIKNSKNEISNSKEKAKDFFKKHSSELDNIKELTDYFQNIKTQTEEIRKDIILIHSIK